MQVEAMKKETLPRTRLRIPEWVCLALSLRSDSQAALVDLPFHRNLGASTEENRGTGNEGHQDDIVEVATAPS